MHHRTELVVFRLMTDWIYLDLVRKRLNLKFATSTRFRAICFRKPFASAGNRSFLWKIQLETWRSSMRCLPPPNRGDGKCLRQSEGARPTACDADKKEKQII